MQIAYLVITLFIGLFLSYAWSGKTWINAILKVLFLSWSIWTFLMLLGTLSPLIQHGGMRLI